jgi:hypothetical protein
MAAPLGPTFVEQGQLGGPAWLPRFRHQPTDLVFALVPSGHLEMGLTTADERELASFIPLEGKAARLVEAIARTASPSHGVEVGAFLVTVRPLTAERVRALSGGRLRSDQVERAEALSLAASLGFRLPSEAELEYLARGLTSLAFTADGARIWRQTGDFPHTSEQGLELLTLGEWAADDWHDDYRGAPSSSEAWVEGRPRGVYRGGLPLGLDGGPPDLPFGLAAFRGRPPLPPEPGDDGRMTFRLALTPTAERP